MTESADNQAQLTAADLTADTLTNWVAAFLLDCRTRNLAPRTVEFYGEQLAQVVTWCQARAALTVADLTPALVRSWLDELEKRGRNAGGRHANYRALRAFLLWWQRENDPADWVNPLAKVRPPKLITEPIQPVTAATIAAMVATCRADFYGTRDKAILLTLADTGARAAELMGLTLADVNPLTGEMLIRQGKGRKPRTVFVGQKARRALRAYLKKRSDRCPALWVNDECERLALSSLRQVLIRRARRAGVDAPSPHDFRRFFALAMWRAGIDLVSIARLMGHTDLETLRRYLAQDAHDLQNAHAKGSPVDGNL